MKRRLLILKTGCAPAAIREARGDFEHWFTRGIDRPVQVHNATTMPPALDDFSGLLITGSPAMVSHREPWAEALLPWLRDAIGRVPVLGVCFGHQLIAHALGGDVGPNPHGRQAGTTTLRLMDGDALLQGFGPKLPVQVAHREVVLTPPTEAAILGATAADPHHVLRFGPACWGVQHHPEFDADITRRYVEVLAGELRSEGQDPAALAAAVRETPAGPDLLARFGRLSMA
ncbi:MAG: glutamine amidotransferase [Pseudomonadota bacterium]